MEWIIKKGIKRQKQTDFISNEAVEAFILVINFIKVWIFI